MFEADGQPKMKNTPLGEAIAPVKLLEAFRSDDKGDDLWHVYNRVQENVIRGGQRGLAVRDENGVYRRRTSTAIRGVASEISLNRDLWSLAENLAPQLVGGN
jgi:Domain of unknown function (DUF932)